MAMKGRLLHRIAGYPIDGFGAGMGLPNIKKNSDEMEIRSDSGGTHLHLKFNIV